jgi:tRNA-dihydrouridine synthase B
MFKPNQIFSAPLAGITDRPYRLILRRCAPDAALVTEMISCHSLVAAAKNCKRNFDRYESEGQIGAQIFGAEPKLMAEAAKILEGQGASWIDINMGCPVPKVATRAGAGAFLMRDHALAGRIISAVVNAVKIPVSIKTRLGWDDAHLDSAELLNIAADLGIKFAAVHGRTRAQGYAGNADWDKIAQLVRGANLPIIFNGDIKTTTDIAAVEKMGASGAMVGRALLGNPWLLGELANSGQQAEKNKADLIMEHFNLVIEYYGEKAGIPMFRKHAAWYSNGMKDAAIFRTRVNQITNAKEMIKILSEFFNN